ncbi:YncE family protein [Flavobacterium sp. W1B]|uniref:YncE family protein n=1 Tax=Flavobacterium sp. W1B TaxID=3394146 RepID=UPI0039BCD618
MKLNNVFFGIFASALLLASCSNDDAIDKDVPLGAYDNGVVILNEGNFGTPNASVSYISNDLTIFMEDVFGTENPGEVLGDVAQSLSFYEDKAFIVMNNSNTVEVVNRYTFKSLATITQNLKNPRYSVALNGKLYVTNSGTKAVTVYDAKTFTYLETIVIGKTSEKIVAANGKLYVMNGSYGSGNTVTVISPQSNNAMSTITVENGINSIEEKNGSVYVLCGYLQEVSCLKLTLLLIRQLQIQIYYIN